MSDGSSFFVDTNVLLYSLDPADPLKQAAARRWLALLWETGTGRVSWQVLHEFYANAVRKLAVPHSGARTIVEAFATWQPVEPTLGLLERAWYWIDNAQVPFWDALIVAAAERSGCAWLLSEDFQPDRRFGELTVIHPFYKQPDDFPLTP